MERIDEDGVPLWVQSVEVFDQERLVVVLADGRRRFLAARDWVPSWRSGQRALDSDQFDQCLTVLNRVCEKDPWGIWAGPLRAA